MRERDRLMDLARKCFEDAADCEDPAQMKIHADMGRRYLEQAEATAAREKSGNGNLDEV
jgi:predicted DNA-binding WGR domain protein